MDTWIEEPKVVVDGEEMQVVVHENLLPGPILCASVHAHKYIEVLYCISGTHEIILNRKKYVFTKGDMVLINSRELHRIEAITDELSDYIVVRFEPDVLYTSYQNAFELKYLLPFTLNDSDTQKIFTASEINDTFLPEVFKELLNDYTNKTYCCEFALRTNICHIFLWILRYWHEKGISIQSKTLDNRLIEQLKPVLEYINKNCTRDITAADMAEFCHMSYSYFSRTFKKTVNKTFREYLNYQRIRKAELLLVTSDMSITDIAMQTGFSSSSYFIQQFKQIKHISPKQFRNKYVSSD